ncbi:uncharacterized protein LOC132735702 isoform X2 [Ruditapes philippinarum]|uniref:uncharacterized protein LOC132735702 isoform X2 n=1 Tax=Ruditapes philippinarum TaxID=129788 RepID=UPI00295AC312|nr:uncharacterized protein LOC132735702 isoform X2 [Ruditapes philippinarum]
MSSSDVTSVCPICGSPEVVHLCSAYMEAKVVKERSKSNSQHDDMQAKTKKPVKMDKKKTKIEKQEKINGIMSEDEPGVKINGADNEYPKYVVIYLGSSRLDRRFPPQTAMPWVMGEVRRSRDTFKEVQLQVHKGVLKAVAYEGLEQIETVFEHNLHTLSRFAKTHQDPRCFAYLQRQTLYSDFECHVFLANEEAVVPELFQNIRGATQRDIFEEMEPRQPEPTKACYEVMYVGRAKVRARKFCLVTLTILL